ncbi:phosphatase 2C-like protein [Trichoderma aethiopicum]
MHRTAVRALRTSHRPSVRSQVRSPVLARGHTHSHHHHHHHNHRLLHQHAHPQRPPGAAHVPLRSSMYFRRLPVALASGLLLGYGAWQYNSDDSVSGAAVTHSFTTSRGAADAAPTRTVLVVGADELRQGTIVGEGPLYKASTEDGHRIVEMLTPDQATAKLRRQEQSFYVNRGQGVTRYDLVQLGSNDPIEDDHAEKIVEVPVRIPAKDPEGEEVVTSSDWMFWGVFDGHSGWTTSATLRESLISYVARELNSTYKASSTDIPPPEAIDSAIKAGFTRLDDEIVHKSVEKVFKASSKAVAAELLQPALSGSCALLSFYDSRSELLRVACTGDSRAVLGRRSKSGKWVATALSEDQTGGNPSEVARMRMEHPGEEHVIRNGRVLGGLEPTRAFGDAVYKWSREVAGKLRENFFGRSPSPLLRTPPYVTAEPVVTTTKIEPENGDFVVLATDGLWEMLTNEEVVGLVGQWIETQKTGKPSSQFDKAWSKVFGSQSKPLPVEQGKEAAGFDGKTPIRVQQWGIDPDARDRFVVRDKNVATHLVRNALGGANDEQVCALLTLPSPFSRRYRDDLTVQVIFFGHGDKTSDKTGDVTVNLDATTDQDPRARL